MTGDCDGGPHPIQPGCGYVWVCTHSIMCPVPPPLTLNRAIAWGRGGGSLVLQRRLTNTHSVGFIVDYSLGVGGGGGRRRDGRSFVYFATAIFLTPHSFDMHASMRMYFTLIRVWSHERFL